MQHDYQFHPIANCFPLMSDAELAALAEDIKANGLIKEIDLYQGMILDGRNRYNACNIAGVLPRTRNFAARDEAHAVAYAIAANLKRKHYSEDQLSMSAHRLANMQRGSNQYEPKVDAENSASIKAEAEAPAISLKAAAEKVGVKRSSVERARKVANKAEAVEEPILEGKMTIREAEHLIEDKGGAPVTEADVQEAIEAKKETKRHKNTKVTPRLITILSDGKWHSLEGLAEAVGVEASRRSGTPLGDALRRIKSGNKLALAEQKFCPKQGTVTWRYRAAPRSAEENSVRLSELKEKLRPIIKVLHDAAKWHSANWQPQAIARQSALLQNYLDEWTSRFAGHGASRDS